MKKEMVIRCSSCGAAQIKILSGNIGECTHCGSTMLLPRQNEEIIALLNSAQIYRENYNYDLAIKSYQYVLEKDATELSAYEGILLSKYGIEYVKDPYSGRLVPTCHRAHFKSIYEDEYYLSLIKIATEEQKQVIEQKIKEIDKLQKAIEKQLKNEQSYDIFISYKATDKNGDKTEDSLIAREIYEELTKKNYKVFLAEKSLENRLGSEYEPIIFKALHTSKLFLLVGTSKENIESNWVRNEWSRFIDRIKNNEDLPNGSFIPVFKNMNPYDMPKVGNNFVQCVDAGKLGYLVTLVDGITKLLKPQEEQSVLKTFTDVENYAEFEKIKKEKKKELKKKHWQELKTSKSITKWLYFAFLCTPFLLGLIGLICSFFLNSHFFMHPLYWIRTICFIASPVLMLVTIIVQTIKYKSKIFIALFSPIALMIASTLIFNLVSVPVTINYFATVGGFHLNLCNYSYDYTENGIVYNITDENKKDTENIVGILKDGNYNKHLTMYNGKKTLVLPENGKYGKIENVYISLPEDIECLVLPKNAQTVNIAVNGETLKEIYCYGVHEVLQQSSQYSSTINQTTISISNAKDMYSNRYTAAWIYYENRLPHLNYTPTIEYAYDSSYYSTQIDLPFYN